MTTKTGRGHYVPGRRSIILAYIAGHMEAHGYAPSYRDMSRDLNLGRQSLHDSIGALELLGRVNRLRARARAIEPTGHVPIPRAPDGAPLYMVRVA